MLQDFMGALGISSLSTVLKALVTLLICYIAMQIVLGIVDRLLNKAKLDSNVKNLIKNAVRVALWALIVIIVADSLGISTASLVAVVSIAGLALSLSVQDIMSNLFSGIIIIINHLFKAGDFIEIGGKMGVIEKVDLFHTTIKTVDNKVVSVPNKEVASASVTNYSSEQLRRVDLVINTDYADKTEDVRAALMDAAQMTPKALTDPAPFVGITEFKDSTIEYTYRVWCKSEDYWDVFFGLNENVRTAFDKHGVHMSFNHVNVHVIQ